MDSRRTTPPGGAGVLGDAVPPALSAYYAALDDGLMAEAAASFSADALYAVGPVGESETAARNEIVGREALIAALERRGVRPFRHEPLLCVVTSDVCLVEGVVLDRSTAAALGSFVCSAHLDDDGLIGRYLVHACSPAVVPGPALGGAAADWGDAASICDRYLTLVGKRRFHEALACFSHDVFYSHPPYSSGPEGAQRVRWQGRKQLLAGLEANSRSTFGHRVLVGGQRGPNYIVEAVVEGLPGGQTLSFVSSLSLDLEGLIRRYVNFNCRPAVAWR